VSTPPDVFEPWWPGFTSALSPFAPQLCADATRLSTFQADLTTLYDLLLTYNSKVNLTRITDPEGFLFRHVLDSLTLLPEIPDGAVVLDLGSGGGFPALPLVLAHPKIHLTALESIGKKCVFIETVANTLALSQRLRVGQGRAEDWAHQTTYRQQFDRVTARAVAPLNILLEWTIPFLKPGGCLLALKGRQSYDKELAESRNALKHLNAQLTAVHTFETPVLAHSAVVMVTKTAPTNVLYPRPTAKIKKQPL